MENTMFVVTYGITDGLFRGEGETDTFIPHSTAPDTALVGSTKSCISSEIVDGAVVATIDVTGVEEWLQRQIDLGAGAARSFYITDVPGQAQTYERKEAEAKAWTEEADPADFPFLTAEATARGVPVTTVRAEILGAVAFLIPLAAQIEAKRMAAKYAVSAAKPHLADMVAAAVVEWPHL
jgi:hypothetical protein